MKAIFRGGPLDGQTREISDCPGASIVVPNYRGEFPYSQFRYEPSGHVIAGLQVWQIAPWCIEDEPTA